MEKKVSILSKEIIVGVIVNIIAATIIAVFSLIWEKFEWNFLWLSIIFAVIIIIQLALFVSYNIWKRKSYKSYYYPKERIPYKYSVNDMCISYELKSAPGVSEDSDPDTLYLSRTVNVTSTLGDLDRISDKYLWTGRSEAKLPEGKNNVRDVSHLRGKPGVWKYFEVNFNRKIEKGQSIDLEYAWPPIENCKTSSAFISTITDVPTKKLTFKIDLGTKYARKPVHFEERRSIDGDNMLSCHEYTLDDCGKIEIPIYPKRFRYFIVFWEW